MVSRIGADLGTRNELLTSLANDAVTAQGRTAILRPCESNRGSRSRVFTPAASIRSRWGTCG